MNAAAGKVSGLAYQMVVIDDRHDFQNAQHWAGILADFDCELKSDQLFLTPRKTFHTVEEARDVIEPFLRAWELDSELNANIRIEFRFSSARVDQTDATSSSTTVSVHAAEVLLISDSATAHVSHSSYPSPTQLGLERTQFVEELLVRIRELRTRSHPMLVVAYLFLTQLEYEYGDRKSAASQLNVDQKILQSIGRLSSKNDPDERRKVKGPVDALTEPERQWLFAALPKIALQVAHVESGKKPPALKMGDLPAL